MEKVLTAVLGHLDQLTITGKDAERMAAIKSMLRDVIKAIKQARQKGAENDP